MSSIRREAASLSLNEVCLASSSSGPSADADRLLSSMAVSCKCSGCCKALKLSTLLQAMKVRERKRHHRTWR